MDGRLRDKARAVSGRDLRREAAYPGERLRLGSLSPARLEVAAYCGDPAAQAVAALPQVDPTWARGFAGWGREGYLTEGGREEPFGLALQLADGTVWERRGEGSTWGFANRDVLCLARCLSWWASVRDDPTALPTAQAAIDPEAWRPQAFWRREVELRLRWQARQQGEA